MLGPARIPKTRLYRTYRRPLLFWRRVFPRALGSGARRGGRVYTRRKIGGRPGSVARALGVRSRGGWQVLTCLLSAETVRCRMMETLIFNFLVLSLLLLYHICVTPCLNLPCSLLRGNHGTPSIAYRALPAVTATVGASVSVRVDVMFPGGTNVYSPERCKDAAQGAARYKPILPPDFKSYRVATVTPAAVQHDHNSLCSYLCNHQDHNYLHLQIPNLTHIVELHPRVIGTSDDALRFELATHP